MGLWESFKQLLSDNPGYILYVVVIALVIPITVLGIVASYKVNSTFKKFQQVTAECGLTAVQIARKMLDDNECEHVEIQRCRGHLSDHFDPRSGIVSLSESVYDSTSIAAIGVACHEAGHAIQHQKKFVFAKVRMALVPVVNFANRMLFPILFIGMLFGFMSTFGLLGDIFVYLGLGIFGASLLFSLVTLPTEFDASRRAQKVLKENYFSSVEAAGSRKVLNAAAMTYVVSFLMSLLQFLRFLAILLMNRRRD